MTELPPPGWYPDPSSPGRERWWNGGSWTEQTRHSSPETGFRRPGELRRVGEFISHVFGAIRTWWRELAALIVIGAGLSALVATPLVRSVVISIDVVDNRLVGWGSEQTIRLVLAGLATVVIYLVVAGALYRVAWDAVGGGRRSWVSALRFGLMIAPRLVAWMLVATLPVLAGMAAVAAAGLVTPGLALIVLLAWLIGLLWWLLIVAMVPIGLVARPGTNPIAVAFEVVRGRWWPILGRLVLISIMAGLVLQVASAASLQIPGLNFYGFEIVGVGEGRFEIVKAVGNPLRFLLGAFFAGLLSFASLVVPAVAAASITADVLETAADQPL